MADQAQQTNSSVQSERTLAALRKHMARATAIAQYARELETFVALKCLALSGLSELADFADDNTFEEWTQAKQAELMAAVTHLEGEMMYLRMLVATHTGNGGDHARPTTGGRCLACVDEAKKRVEARTDDSVDETEAGEDQT